MLVNTCTVLVLCQALYYVFYKHFQSLICKYIGIVTTILTDEATETGVM